MNQAKLSGVNRVLPTASAFHPNVASVPALPARAIVPPPLLRPKVLSGRSEPLAFLRQRPVNPHLSSACKVFLREKLAEDLSWWPVLMTGFSNALQKLADGELKTLDIKRLQLEIAQHHQLQAHPDAIVHLEALVAQLETDLGARAGEDKALRNG